MDLSSQEQKNKNLLQIFIKGSIFSKLSFVICGLANMVYGQVVKGEKKLSCYMAQEVIY